MSAAKKPVGGISTFELPPGYQRYLGNPQRIARAQSGYVLVEIRQGLSGLPQCPVAWGNPGRNPEDQAQRRQSGPAPGDLVDGTPPPFLDQAGPG